jgi:glycosyltransferase involved in cell wall biosynthesis
MQYMATKNKIENKKLTICAIGSSESSHVVSRVKCFAERGHRVYLLSNTVSGLEGVIEIVPQAIASRWLHVIFKLVNAFSTKVVKQSLLPYEGTVYLLYNYLHILKQCKPDIVHVHYAYSTWGWMAAVASYPLVVSIMGGDVLFEEQGSPTPRGKWLTLQLLQSANFITSKSDYLISVLNKLGGFGSKAMKVVWGVDLTHFHPLDATELRIQLGLSPQHRVILSPKILRPFYNVHLIVEAMLQIIAAHPEARLLITEYSADPDYRKQIAERVDQLGLQDYVMFVGHIPHHEMPLYYSLAEVTVAVPSSDGLPQTLLEGMACAVPNILSRLPRYEEVVTHAQSAYFVDSSPQGIAEGVRHLFSDCELSAHIVHNGLEIVQTQADFVREVSRVESKYYEVLARPRSRRPLLARARILREVFRYFVQP